MLFESDGNPENSQQCCREGNFVVAFLGDRTIFYVPRPFWYLTNDEMEALAAEVFVDDEVELFGPFRRDVNGHGYGLYELPPMKRLVRTEWGGLALHSNKEKVEAFVVVLERFLAARSSHSAP